jgi:diacylglycerol O-acyltransferase
MSQQLDRAKPLWELWVAEGLDDGRWALISKSHHCMVDGVSATDLLSVILSTEREPSPDAPDGWKADREPNAAELIAHSLALRAASPYEAVRTVLATARGPRRMARQVVGVTRGLANLRPLLSPTPPTSLNGPIGPHRRWDWARARLGQVKQIREAHGGTVNDVVLAAITGGFRELLLSRGESVEGRVVRTLVPVSVRAEQDRGTYNNKVSAMFAELPVELEDPLERLDSLHEQMRELKNSGQAVAAERLTALGGFAPAMLLALGGRVASRLPQSSINTVTTNVPGPQQPLYLAGLRMLEAFPFVPLGGAVRIGVAIFSYDGGINFGVTGDRDSAADIGVLCRGIEHGVAELLNAALPKSPVAPPAPSGDGRHAASAIEK